MFCSQEKQQQQQQHTKNQHSDENPPLPFLFLFLLFLPRICKRGEGSHLRVRVQWRCGPFEHDPGTHTNRHQQRRHQLARFSVQLPRVVLRQHSLLHVHLRVEYEGLQIEESGSKLDFRHRCMVWHWPRVRRDRPHPVATCRFAVESCGGGEGIVLA